MQKVIGRLMVKYGQAAFERKSSLGEDTAQRLIETALELFANHGFAGTSTRMLADKAQVNLSAIPYYFGGKEGLYRAAAEYIVAEIKKSIAPVLDKVNSALERSELPRELALTLLCEVLDAFVATHVSGPNHWALFAAREELNPTSVFDILYDSVAYPIHITSTKLVARILDRPIDDPETLIRTTAIMGQVFIFQAARPTMLRRFGWSEFTDERIAMIQAVIHRQTSTMLLGRSSDLDRTGV
ncbi:MAG: CerR family C-terminal domain-containing protein [Steroidobacteraceae bacterium]